MPNRILEADDFATTLFYTEDRIEAYKGEGDSEYFKALRKSPALAMIAAKIHDLITVHNPIRADRLGVLMVNLPDEVGFQLMLDKKTPKRERRTFGEVARDMQEAALGCPGITCGAEGLLYFSARKIETLLKFIVDFADTCDYDFDRIAIDIGYNGDFEAFHAQWEDKDRADWREDAESALRLPWVVAALPEKIFPTRDLLLQEAYRTRHLGVYSREQIREAIEAQKPADKRQTREGWTHAYH